MRHQAQALDRFIGTLDQLVRAGGPSQPSFQDQLCRAMGQLIARDDWLPDAVAQPHPQYYQQYCLYADPDDRFSVVSFVWGPGQFTPIHNHTVWGVIGVLRGSEIEQAYELSPAGVPVAVGEPHVLNSGDVGFVSPPMRDVHRVSNAHADRVSISIHAYGGNIGKINRHVFPPDGGAPKPFVSGYSAPMTA